MRITYTALFLLTACSTPSKTSQPPANEDHTNSTRIVRLAEATMAELCGQYQEDKAALNRLMPYSMSEFKNKRLKELYQEWSQKLSEIDFSNLQRNQQIDWLALNNSIDHDLDGVEIQMARELEVAPLLPFIDPLVLLVERRSRRENTAAEDVATVFHNALENIELAKTELLETAVGSASVSRRARQKLSSTKRALANLYNFRKDYDPEFGWWCEQPWFELSAALDDYGSWVERELGGLNPDDQDALVGDPIGEEALIKELSFERIPYSPAELIEIAEQELQWCNQQRKNAATQMGLGDDWRAAQHTVKGIHVEPGKQPSMILGLANQAVDFLEDNNLVSIPKIAKEAWRMEMMSPERQKISPYFTGGEVISIAFPTDGMSHEAKLQSMRGNNLAYSHATVHHELIPGHHLQGYMAKRWNPHRRMFYTPFLVEGWALYWELQLWDWGFANSPEEEIGMLFWRSHRCARIIFSLNFHLGNWSPQECVDFLVENVGHERRNAEAEVRRSIQGGYGPLYQCAYMLGGMQLRSLYNELVVNGEWNKRDFHDAILRQGPIPIDLIRAALGDQELSKTFPANWKFSN